MKNTKKLATLLLASTLTLSTISSAYAMGDIKAPILKDIQSANIGSKLSSENNFEDSKQIIKEIELKNYREENLNIQEKELLNKNIQSAIQVTEGLDNTTENIEVVKMLLRDDVSVEQDGNFDVYINRSGNKKRKPKIRIRVKTAAAAFNAIIFFIAAGATGGTGAAAMRALIKKMGTFAARNYIKRRAVVKIKNKLIAWGMSKYAGIVPGLLGSALFNLLDPGTDLARALDRRDGWGANGYIEV